MKKLVKTFKMVATKGEVVRTEYFSNKGEKFNSWFIKMKSEGYDIKEEQI